MRKVIGVSAAVATTIGLLAAWVVFSPASNAITNGKSETTVGPHMAIGECNGTLVSRKWVVTAWYCYDGQDINKEIGYWGNLDYLKGHKVKVVEVCHRYNMAMVRIDPPLPAKLPKNVSLARLGKKDPPVGAKVTIKGWGSDKWDSWENGGILRSAKVKVAAPWLKGVADGYGGPGFNVSELPGGGMAAWGDDGSPAYYKGKIVGIVSTRGVVDKAKVTGFSSVAPHLNWINALLKGKKADKLPMKPSPAVACVSDELRSGLRKGVSHR